MDGYGSHFFVLEKLLQDHKIESVLETGMGYNSTPFFIKKCRIVYSIEMQEESWYNNVVGSFKNADNFKPILLLDPKKAIEYIDFLGRFDAIFVDGYGKNRWEQVNKAQSHTDLVIVHDTEAKHYRWDKVIIPKNWVWIDIVNAVPWTSVLTPNVNILETLKVFTTEKYKESIKDKRYLNYNILD